METLAGIKIKNFPTTSKKEEAKLEFIQLAFKTSPQPDFDVEVINLIQSGNWTELKRIVDAEHGKSSSSGQRESDTIGSETTTISVGTGNGGGSRVQNDGGWVISLSKEGFGGYEKKQN